MGRNPGGLITGEGAGKEIRKRNKEKKFKRNERKRERRAEPGGDRAVFTLRIDPSVAG